MASSRLLGPPPSFRYLNDDVAVGRRETSTLVQRAAVKDGIVEETPVGRQLKRDAVSRRTGDGRGATAYFVAEETVGRLPRQLPCRTASGGEVAGGGGGSAEPSLRRDHLPQVHIDCQHRPHHVNDGQDHDVRACCACVRACVPARRTKRSFGRHRTHRSRSSGCSPAGWRLAGCRSPIYTGGSERPSRWPEEELRAVQVGQ